MANLGYLQLVRHCNQYCRICSNPETAYELDLPTAMRAIDDLVARHYQGVVLTGGEPSLSAIVEPVVAYALGRGLSVRMITNGSRVAEPVVARSYVEAGLRHFHVSLYSHRAEVHDAITCVKGSHAQALQAIRNLQACGAEVHVNTVISRFNCEHLHELARMLAGHFPQVPHVVINNLDPLMGRAQSNPEVVHRLVDMHVSLLRALGVLAQSNKSFRVERVPLCFMTEFAYASTETRKIIKGEERLVHFLDEKGTVRQTSFAHSKAPVCHCCSLDSICAGLYAAGQGYDVNELAPVFVAKEPIVRRVLQGDR